MADAKFATVTLDHPFTRGEREISEVQVRRPAAGELRGLNLQALHANDYTALETLLPRITEPALTKQEVAQLDPADFSQLGGEVLDFLLPKSVKAAFPQG